MYEKLESAGYPARKAKEAVLEGELAGYVPLPVEEIGRLFLLASEARDDANRIAEEASAILDALSYAYLWPGDLPGADPGRDSSYYRRMHEAFAGLAEQFGRELEDAKVAIDRAEKAPATA